MLERFSNKKLEIETERFRTNKKGIISEHKIICTLCNLGSLENDVHLVFCCPQ